MSRKQVCVQTFTLPAQDGEATELMNRRGVTILINERYPCPRDGVILLYLQYEFDLNAEEDDDDQW